MNLLQIVRGCKSMGIKQLFSDAQVSVNSDEHIGVIGPNGAGKTTLFKVLSGEESLDSGEFIRSQQLRLGYLKQESEWNVEISVESYIEQNAVLPIWEIKKRGRLLGLTEEIYQRPIKELSGGYRMRVQLLKLLGQDPNLLLLDEPTNFLDLETTLVLEAFLQDYEGAFLLISHDREFLKRTTDHIVEVEQGKITKFPGHIEDYFEQKQELQKQLEAEARNQEAKIKHMMDFVERFRAKATKARQAQSRLKQVSKIQKIELSPLPVRARIHIPEPITTGKETLLIENLAVGYNQQAVVSSINLRLLRGDHLGIVGVNGAGKSTLLKTIFGLNPAVAGQVKIGHQVVLSYFAQHSTDELHMEESILQAMQRKSHPDVTLQEIKNLAGSLLFAGDDINKKIKVLSGGEKSRVALGQVLLQRNPVLLLDEPTNHLDFETVEALTQALGDYTGTLLIVSHDRSFMKRVASKILEIESGRAEFYPGNYEDYVWSQQQKLNLLVDEKATTDSVESKPAEKFNYRDQVKKLQTELNQQKKRESDLSKKIEDWTLERNEILQKMESEAVSKELFQRLASLSQEIEQSESELLDIYQAIEDKDAQLQSLLRN